MATGSKPHAVFTPFPALSHIKALLKLAKLLYLKGFHITFVNTQYGHRRNFLLQSQSSDSLRSLPGFRFETIPDGLPPSENTDASHDFPTLINSIRKNLLAPFMELLKKINDDDSNPLVSCICSDGFMPFSLDAARAFGIPDFMFFSFSASFLMSVKQFGALKEKGLVPLEDAHMDRVIDWIPGMKDIRFRDLPSYVRIETSELIFNYIMESVDGAADASAIIVQTFDALEEEVLDALSYIYPKIYTIAPLELLLINQAPQDQNPLVSCSLWKEENECLQWLDRQKPNSVVYVNFGSIATMEADQLVEFAMGIVKSDRPFLWIIRTNFVEGEKAVLPSEFIQKIKEERGFVATWCDQEEVLNHPSIGGFVTHGGWNSMVESLSSGVPMLCCPCFSDQPTNCWLARGELGAAIEIGRDGKREDVEKMVNELMEGEKGKMMKEKAMEWRRLAHEAVAAPNGSSSTNLDSLVNQVHLSM